MARPKIIKNTKTSRRQKPRESSYLKITAVLASVFAVGFFVKIAFFQSGVPLNPVGTSYQPPTVAYASIEDQVRQVALKFRCACGGCGELPLAECTCEMPRGAKEEKDFIRNKLRDGLSVDQVVQLVQDVYGHMTT